MSDPEITALRTILAQRTRSDDIAQRRRDIDERGRQNKLASDVTVELANANGVKAEWTTDTGCGSCQGGAVSTWRRLRDRIAG